MYNSAIDVILGRISKWKWVWDGRFSCPSLNNSIQGTSGGLKSRNGAIEHAVRNFMEKAINSGVINADMAAQYYAQNGK